MTFPSILHLTKSSVQKYLLFIVFVVSQLYFSQSAVHYSLYYTDKTAFVLTLRVISSCFSLWNNQVALKSKEIITVYSYTT